MEIRLKRVYEAPDNEGGFRILVDRLWPRGLTKEKAKVDLWMKEISPSNDLRKAFHSEKMEWKDFRKQYLLELRDQQENLELIKKKAEEGPVTLVFGAKDPEQNQAVVILEVLNS